MDKKQAIEAIRHNWPDSRYSMLREALDIAIAAIEESMVQKPATNSRFDKIAALVKHSWQRLRKAADVVRNKIFSWRLYVRFSM